MNRSIDTSPVSGYISFSVKIKISKGEEDMRKVLSVFIAVCLVLSLFTGVFASLPFARADTSGDYQYTVAGGNATITGYTGSGVAIVIPATLGTSPTYPVTSIGDRAFYSTQGHLLTSVTIPSSVTSIGNYAFAVCKGLTSVTIPSNVTSIGNHAFIDCTGLTSVTIPNSVTSIGDSAFAGCTGLTSVTIPSSMTSIGQWAFEYCSGLTSVTIPNSVTSIGDSAFFRCSGLTSVTIPNSVTSIDNRAFEYCSGLTSVTIPSSVTSVGNLAFAYCPRLTAAYFLGNAPTGATLSFDNCAVGFTVHYVSGTTGWTNPWYTYPATAVRNTTKKQIVLVLHIGKSAFTINGSSKTLDSSPVIKNGRTLVPIRAIIEALAGTVGWDATTKKATVTLGKKTIALWIGKSAATVNGVSTPIDSTNAKVVPEIINSRTMLPLRFVTENLGATVGWDQNTQTITITYRS